MMKRGGITIEEVESLLGYKIDRASFEEALRYASQKRDYIYKQDGRIVVLQKWYLIQLTAEYVRNLAYSRLTEAEKEKRVNMEKERLVKVRDAGTQTHIYPNIYAGRMSIKNLNIWRR